jgi:hypothetical protein
MARFETTWVRVRNATDCPKCGRRNGLRCVSRTGREMSQLHMARVEQNLAEERERWPSLTEIADRIMGRDLT